ncbi:hypothetical protein IWW45_003051 [Coemansia sp. RSA 485]|nr:hypothetical protein IWW45_003051 [Coemansia sp. RSA 485]
MTLQEQWVKAAQRGGDMETANRKPRRVVRIILMNMTFEFANEFIGFDQAYELWQALENRFEVLLAMDIKNLVIEIATIRYNGNVASMARRCNQIKKQLKDNNVSVETVIDILSEMNSRHY